MNLLIVDNDVSTVITLEASLLSAEKFTIDKAYGGKEGLEKMKASANIDLVLLDIMMPDISGIDVCKAMVADKELAKIPVLLMSALPITSKDFQESLKEFNELQVVKGVLEKPFSVDDLISKVDTITKK